MKHTIEQIHEIGEVAMLNAIYFLQALHKDKIISLKEVTDFFIPYEKEDIKDALLGIIDKNASPTKEELIHIVIKTFFKSPIIVLQTGTNDLYKFNSLEENHIFSTTAIFTPLNCKNFEELWKIAIDRTKPAPSLIDEVNQSIESKKEEHLEKMFNYLKERFSIIEQDMHIGSWCWNFSPNYSLYATPFFEDQEGIPFSLTYHNKPIDIQIDLPYELTYDLKKDATKYITLIFNQLAQEFLNES